MGDQIPGEDNLVGNTLVDLGDDAGDTGHIVFLADQAWSPVQGSKFCRGGVSRALGFRGITGDRDVGPPGGGTLASDHHLRDDQDALLGGVVTERERAKTHQAGAWNRHRIVDLGVVHQLFPGCARVEKTIRASKGEAQGLTQADKPVTQTLESQRVLGTHPLGERALVTHGAGSHQQRGCCCGHPHRLVRLGEDMPGGKYSRQFVTLPEYSRERDHRRLEQKTRRSSWHVQRGRQRL